MELQGKVKKIGETQTFASGFQKRELVLETDEQYKEDIDKALDDMGWTIDDNGNCVGEK